MSLKALGVALRDWLLAQPAVAALVGVKVRPVVAPQPDAYPRVLTQLAGRQGRQCLTGGAQAGKGVARYSVVCQARDHDQAWAVADAILAAGLDGYRGFMGPDDGTQFSVVARVDDVREDASPPAHGEGVWDVSVILDVTLNYGEIP